MEKKNHHNKVTPFLLVSSLLIGIAGWVLNIISLIKIALQDDASITALLLLKIAGIFFAPLGAILGWVTI